MIRRPPAAVPLLAAAALLGACDDRPVGPGALPTDTVVTNPHPRITTGESFACALTPAGRAYCWGANERGRLGVGDTTDRRLPTAVAGDHVFAAVSAGGTFACALEFNGRAWCWGRNWQGQLGDGTRDDRHAPVPVAGGHRFLALDAGRSHTCAIDVEGRAWCWGGFGFGALGPLGPSNDSPLPVEVPGYRFTAIRAGAATTCALGTDGDAYCWGNLGVHRPSMSGLWREPRSMGPGYTDVEPDHSGACGLAGERLTCWMPEGELEPSPVVELVTRDCGLDSEGAAWCWRLRYHPEAGPLDVTPLAEGHRFQELALGWEPRGCGLKADGRVYCWSRGSGPEPVGGPVFGSP